MSVHDRDRGSKELPIYPEASRALLRTPRKAPKDRPGFRRVLELAEAQAFSVLLVWKFDRLARSLLFSVTTVNELQERHRVVLRSITEPIDTATPIGNMIFAILASFAAEERRVITGRTLGGIYKEAC